MNRLRCFVSVLVTCFFLSASADTAQKSAADLLVGTWKGQIQGQEMTIKYDGGNVIVEQFGMNIPYTVEDNVLKYTVPQVGERIYTLTFPSENEMIRTDQQGVVTTLTRVSE